MSLQSTFASTADQLEKQVEAVFSSLQENAKGGPGERLVEMSKDASLAAIRQWREFNENTIAFLEQVATTLRTNTEKLLGQGGETVSKAAAVGKSVAAGVVDAVEDIAEEVVEEVAEVVESAREAAAKASKPPSPAAEPEPAAEAPKPAAAPEPVPAAEAPKPAAAPEPVPAAEAPEPAAAPEPVPAAEAPKPAAEPEPAAEPKPAKAPSLKTMTKAELLDFAKSEGVDVKTSMTKAQIVQAIEG